MLCAAVLYRVCSRQPNGFMEPEPRILSCPNVPLLYLFILPSCFLLPYPHLLCPLSLTVLYFLNFPFILSTPPSHLHITRTRSEAFDMGGSSSRAAQQQQDRVHDKDQIPVQVKVHRQ